MVSVLNLTVMGTRGFRAALLLVLLSGCATAVPDHQLPPDGLVWSPEGPFSKDTKAVIPDEASAFNHFLKGQLLLIDGEFEPALKEFEAATQASPTDGFLHFRLAQLYLRRGELKKALSEAELAARLEPKVVDYHLLLAGLYSAVGDNQKGLTEYNEVLKLDPKNPEALL